MKTQSVYTMTLSLSSFTASYLCSTLQRVGSKLLSLKCLFWSFFLSQLEQIFHYWGLPNNEKHDDATSLQCNFSFLIYHLVLVDNSPKQNSNKGFHEWKYVWFYITENVSLFCIIHRWSMKTILFGFVFNSANISSLFRRIENNFRI